MNSCSNMVLPCKSTIVTLPPPTTVRPGYKLFGLLMPWLGAYENISGPSKILSGIPVIVIMLVLPSENIVNISVSIE